MPLQRGERNRSSVRFLGLGGSRLVRRRMQTPFDQPDPLLLRLRPLDQLCPPHEEGWRWPRRIRNQYQDWHRGRRRRRSRGHRHLGRSHQGELFWNEWLLCLDRFWKHYFFGYYLLLKNPLLHMTGFWMFLIREVIVFSLALVCWNLFLCDTVKLDNTTNPEIISRTSLVGRGGLLSSMHFVIVWPIRTTVLVKCLGGCHKHKFLSGVKLFSLEKSLPGINIRRNKWPVWWSWAWASH